jgi:death-on-curing protein
VNPAAVLRVHEESLIVFGGAPGIRDQGAIDSALARPQNLLAYGQPDICDLAAAYTVGLCQNHGFVDGNKRIAFLTGFTFLYENGYTITAEQAEVVAAMLSVADHTLDEAGYAAWLREHVLPPLALAEPVSGETEATESPGSFSERESGTAASSPPAIAEPDPDGEAIELITRVCPRPDADYLRKADEMAGGREKLVQCLRFMIERNRAFETGEPLLCHIYDQCHIPHSEFAEWVRRYGKK